MAIILEERGRGKFKPAPDYNADEVKELLNAKIEEERMAFANCSEQIEFDKLQYDENKWNLLEWLTTQTEYQIPPALRGIREEAMSLSDLLDWEFEDIREKFLDE